MKKMVCIITVFIMLLMFNITPVSAISPFEGYRYDYWNTALPMPNGYDAVDLYTAEKMEIDKFGTSDINDLNDPSDLFCAADGSFYIADTGNNRILKLNSYFICIEEFKTFTLENGGTTELSSPNGIYVDSDGLMYIADTNNYRVVIANQEGKVKGELVKPDTDIFPEGVEFAATKVLKDQRGVFYVLVNGLYYGAASFNRNYEFTGFYGSNKVKLNASQLAEVAWRKIFPKESTKYQSNYVPLELSNMCVDKDGYVYTCTSTQNTSEKIRKLNGIGLNILNQTNFGDALASYENGVSTDTSFIDIAVDENGFINALDYTRGRVFQYDEEGELMFIYGGIGNQLGLFQTPTAIETYNGKVYILDKQKKTITVFEPNTLAQKTHYAISLYNKGLYEEAIQPWKDVLRTDTGNTFAYKSIGKAYFAQENYELAMENYQQGQDRTGFSKAYKEYRTQRIRHYFPLIGGIVTVLLIILFTYIKRRKLAPVLSKIGIKVKTEPASSSVHGIGYIGYILRHPIEGYEEMKYKQGGNPLIALGILAIWFVLMIFKYTSTGFVYNSNKPGQINIGIIFLSTVCIAALWVVANWSLCTLLDGEGKMREIFVHSVYALVPYIATVAISIILSNVLTLDEGAFITWITLFGILWSGFLLYSAMMTLHNYSGAKTFVCLFLTVVAMVVIAFLLILCFTLVQQMISFAVTIWRELSFRMY